MSTQHILPHSLLHTKWHETHPNSDKTQKLTRNVKTEAQKPK